MSDQETIQKLSDELEKAKVTIKEQQTVIDSIVPPEAIYSYSTNGQSETWTVRARVGEDGKSFFHRVDNFLKYANEHGKALTREQVVAASPAAPMSAASAPAQSNDEGGVAHAVLMKIGVSYSGNKPQLQFECDGMEHPLSYTRPVADMIKLLAPVGKYTPEMLENGKKYAVDYQIEWKLGDPNGDGKRYRNILAVKKA